jgi:hypothetical protein
VKENTQPLHPGPCPIANAVAAAVLERSRIGHKKYGVTLARLDLDLRQWLQHLQEELLDAAGYVERLKAEVGEKPRAAEYYCFACGGLVQLGSLQVHEGVVFHDDCFRWFELKHGPVPGGLAWVTSDTPETKAGEAGE